MKSPLLYQMTEKDCGETAIKNALLVLYDREEIPLELVHILSSYSLACHDDDGKLLENSFSKNILFFVSSWIRDFAKEKHISLSAKYFKQQEVNFIALKRAVSDGAVVVLKTFRRGTHFVTVTKIDEDYVYIFDPYYVKKSSLESDSRFEIIYDKPHLFNRKVRIEEFIKERSSELSLGNEESREALVLVRDNAILQREFV